MPRLSPTTNMSARARSLLLVLGSLALVGGVTVALVVAGPLPHPAVPPPVAPARAALGPPPLRTATVHPEAEAPSAFGGPSVDRQQLAEARRLRAERLAQGLDRLLAGEAADERFRSELEAQVQSLITLPVLRGARLAELRCGATLCRAVVGFADVASLQRLHPLLESAGRLTGDGPAFVRPLADGEGQTPTAAVYFSRDRPLPHAEALATPL